MADRSQKAHRFLFWVNEQYKLRELRKRITRSIFRAYFIMRAISVIQLGIYISMFGSAIVYSTASLDE